MSLNGEATPVSQEMADLLKTLKAQRAGYIGQVTKLEKKFQEQILIDENYVEVVKVKGDLNDAFRKCMASCSSYVNAIPEDNEKFQGEMDDALGKTGRIAMRREAVNVAYRQYVDDVAKGEQGDVSQLVANESNVEIDENRSTSTGTSKTDRNHSLKKARLEHIKIEQQRSVIKLQIESAKRRARREIEELEDKEKEADLIAEFSKMAIDIEQDKQPINIKLEPTENEKYEGKKDDTEINLESRSDVNKSDEKIDGKNSSRIERKRNNVNGSYIADINDMNDVKNNLKQQHFKSSSGNYEGDKNYPNMGAEMLDMSATLIKFRELGDCDKFDGDSAYYFTFIDDFRESVKKHVKDPRMQLRLLIDSCKGDAKKSIESCLILKPAEKALATAFDILKEDYGRPDKIRRAFMNKIVARFKNDRCDNFINDDEKCLKDALSDLRNCYMVLSVHGYGFELDSTYIIEGIFKRFSKSLKLRFNNYISKMEKVEATFQDVISFVRDQAFKASTSYGKIMTETKTDFKGRKHFARVNNVQSSKERKPIKQSDRKTGSCYYCKKEHMLFRCEDFKKMPVRERFDWVKQKGYCINCFSTKHTAKECDSNYSCRVCKDDYDRVAKHHTLLHFPKNKNCVNDDVNETRVKNNSVACVPLKPNIHCIFKVCAVRIFGENNTFKDTWALLDDACSETFITTSLMNELNIRGKKGTTTMVYASGMSERNESTEVSFLIRGLYEKRIYKVKSAFAINSLPDVRESIPSNLDVSVHQHLRDIKIPDLNVNNVEIMIGGKETEILDVKSVRRGLNNDMIATRTGIGFVFHGRTQVHRLKNECKINFVNTDNDALHEAILNVFGDNTRYSKNAESVLNEKSEDIMMSRENEYCMKLMRDNAVLVNGKWQIPLLWKPGSKQKLKNNRELVMKRLLPLRKRFVNDNEFRLKYHSVINEMFNADHLGLLNEGESPSDVDAWYLAHFATGKSKFRIVFDARAKDNTGVSINQCLFKGDENLNSLCGILLRFRLRKIGITADVEKMFFQVKIPQEDRKYLRILYWEDGNVDSEAKDFAMNMHTYGLRDSLCVCNFALKLTADRNMVNVSDFAVQTVKNDFFVNDLVTAVNNEYEGEKCIKEIDKLMDSGGFNLTKWASNNKSLLKNITKNKLSPGIIDLDFGSCMVPMQKTLGVFWDMNDSKDFLIAKVKCFNKGKVTRRTCLSDAFKLFDPCGLFQVFLMPFKSFLQRLCQMKLGWDTPIPHEMKAQWIKLIEALRQIEGLKLPRWIGYNDSMENVSLHVFVDASMTGMCACCYIRFVNEGEVIVHLLMSKTRICPLKAISIPRLELCAAVLGARLGNMIYSELKIRAELTYWSDSTITLRYIKNPALNLPRYVAHRVNLITALSDPLRWQYVDSKNNSSADMGSRGLIGNQIEKCETWFSGPEFLKRRKDEWPTWPNIDIKDVSDLEKKKCVTICNVKSERDDYGLDMLICRYSSFDKLIRICAWHIRVITYLKNRIKCVDSSEIFLDINSLSVIEIEHAADMVIRYVQKNVFRDVIAQLSDNENTSDALKCYSRKHKTSMMSQLRPILVNSMLRVGGRIKNCTLPQDFKFPILLPKKHHLTDIIIDHYHFLSGHSGSHHTLSKIRTKYWILHGLSAVSSRLLHCRKCRRWKGSVGKQFLSDLPADRIEPYRKCWTAVGVDLAGPFKVKVARHMEKRYVCVFTDLAVRCVHFEVVYSLDTSSFIKAIIRFISHRSVFPKDIYCDNGTNLVGAEREIREIISGWNQKQISDELSRSHIQWHFNAPGCSHAGGVYERMFRTLRKCMLSMTEGVTLKDEDFLTVVCEIATIMNSRPITHSSSDSRDDMAITPNDILGGTVDATLPTTEPMTGNDYRRSYRRCQFVADKFWKRFINKYLSLLQSRQKWLTPQRNFRVGDVVLVVEPNCKRNHWPKAIIVDIMPGSDGLVRRVLVRKATGSVLERDIRKLCLLEASN